MKRIVEIGGKGKVKKAEAGVIKRLQEYGALALDVYAHAHSGGDRGRGGQPGWRPIPA